MKHKSFGFQALVLLAGVVCVLPGMALAVEDGLGTNVVKNIRVLPSGGIELDSVRITSWGEVGDTNAIADLKAATNALNISVTNLIISTNSLNIAVGDLQLATNALNGRVGSLELATNALNSRAGSLELATNELNTSVGSLEAATNALHLRGIRWDNAVIATNGTGGPLTTAALYYYTPGGSWSLANASTSSTAVGMLGLALGPSVTEHGLLINGYCDNAWGFNAGDVIYVDTNSGALASSRPTGTNNIVRIVGYAISSSRIYFNPDRTFIEILGD